MKLDDFSPLGPAEQRLVDWLQRGNRGTCEISEEVPEAPTPDVTLRATLIRYLALGGCEACRPPETGVRVKGAWIKGDDSRGNNTRGLDFEGASLPFDLGLRACRIPDRMIFRSAKVRNLFLGESCLGAEFMGDRLQAAGGIFLRNTKVLGSLSLDGARIGGDLVCEGTKLRATVRALSADRSQIAGTMFMCDNAEIGGRVSLIAAEIGDVHDDPRCWPQRIELDHCRYRGFLGPEAPTDANRRLDWLSRSEQQPGEFRPDAYEHCAKVLREMGHEADARVILIEKEKLQRKAQREREGQALAELRKAMAEKPGLQGKFIASSAWLWLRTRWDGALGFFVGYGRKPLNALWRGLLPMWAIGTVVFLLVAWVGQIKPNLPQLQVHPAWVDCAEWGARRWPSHATQVACFRDQPEGQSYPHFNALFYSADTLFPVVSLEMQSYWIPDDTKPLGMLARWYLWAHIIMGWALTLLAVAGFSGLIKTDSK